MSLKNFLASGHEFSGGDAYLAFRFRVLNYFMAVAVLFGMLIGVLGMLGIMQIGTVQSWTDLAYALFNLFLIVWLRQNITYFMTVAWLLVASSFLTFLIALINVPNDEFRFVWFFVAVYIAYILLGVRAGIGVTLASITALLLAHRYTDLQLSDTAVYTAIFGLIVASLLTQAYSRQITSYEGRLNKKNRELEQNVKQLDHALGQARDASRSKSLFLAKMSHEIRTPMNGVLSMVEVLKTTTRLDEQQQLYLNSVERSGKTLLTLIDDLLDISKIESGRMELQPHPFKTWPFIEDILIQIEPLFDHRPVSLSVNITNDMPAWLMGDEVRLKQVITNLVSNAAKFTHQGEVKVLIDGRVNAGDIYHLHIEVSDTGVGIPEDRQKTIFEPFMQLSPERIYNKGVGLGLPICKTILDSMKGSLQVRSKAGEGSCFIVDVSLPRIEHADVETQEQEADLLPERLCVLLVDDDPVSRLAVKTLITKAGSEVVEVENGEEAIQQLQGNGFDIILMDVHMPVMDGVTATRIIKSNKLSPALIIGMTASVMNDERVGYLQAGMDALVEKPLDFRHLAQVIKNRLRHESR